MNGKSRRFDDSGKVPFALVAVLIVIFAGISAVYVATLNQQQGRDANERLEDMKDLMDDATGRIRHMGEEAVLTAVGGGASGSGLVWKIGQDAYGNLASLMGEYLSSEGVTTDNGFNVKVLNPVMTVSPVPFEYEDYNTLGMKARMRTNVYLRTVGSAEVFITDTQTEQRLNSTVTLDNLIPSAKFFLAEQAMRFQREANGDTSVDSDVAEMTEYMLRQRTKSKDEVVTQNDVTKALNVAILLEEIKLFHDYDEGAAQVMFSNGWGFDFSGYIAGRTYVDPAEIFPGPGWGDGSVLVDVSSYGKPFQFSGARSRMSDATASLRVHHQGSPFYITMAPGYYTAFERVMYYSDGSQGFDKAIYAYDINLTTNQLAFSVESGDALSPGQDESLTMNVALDLNLRFKDGSSQVRDPMAVRVPNSLYENVIDEYSGYLKGGGDIELMISNSSSVPIESLDGVADIYLDGEFLGAFDSSPILKGVAEGTHELLVELFYPDGSSEYEHESFNLTPSGLLEGLGTKLLEMNLSFEGPDTTQLWELLGLVLKNTPSEKRLTDSLKWLSSLVGFPYPAGAEYVNDTNDALTLKGWLGEFSGYLDSLSDFWDPSFSNLLESSEMVVDFYSEVMDLAEIMTEDGLDISEMVMDLGEDAVELHFKDPYKNAIAKLTLKALKGKGSSMTFNIGGKVIKEKVLGNLKTMGDILALVGIAVSVFKLADSMIKVFSSDNATPMDYVDATFDFVEVMLKFWNAAIRVAERLGTEGLEKAATWLQRASSVVLIIYLFVSELINNNWDILKTLESLFMGFDDLSVSWYSAIIGAIAYEVLAPISAAAATGVGILIAVVAILIILILHWDEFMAWINHTLSSGQVAELEKSIGGSLRDTLNLTASINGMQPSGYAPQARQYYGLFVDMLRRSFFSATEAESKSYLNLSRYAFDFYETYRDLGANALRARGSVKMFWLIASDFDSINYPQDGNGANAVVMHGTESMTDHEIVLTFLSSATAADAKHYDITYDIIENPEIDAFDAWKADLDKVGDLLSDGVGRFQRSMARLKYLNVVPNPSEYSRDYGALVVDYEPYSGLGAVDLIISPQGGGLFQFAYKGAWYTQGSFAAHVTADSTGTMESTVLIVKGGTYEIITYNSNVAITSFFKTVTVSPGESTSHNVEVDKVFSFRLNSTYIGYVVVNTYKDDALSTQTSFYSPGTAYISVPTGTSTFKIVAAWDTDGNLTNGTEVVKSTEWKGDWLAQLQTVAGQGFMLEFKVKDPNASNWYEETFE